MRPGDIVTLAAQLFLVLAAGWLRRKSRRRQRQIAGLGLLGAALGRYHYALDVILGALLSLGILCLVR
jgi:hypothetical protein